MFAVIMAGGAGTRLWPLSRRGTPKQLLPLTGDSSLLQQTVRRTSSLLKPEDIYVITAAAYVRATRAQLPQLPEDNVLGEPLAELTAHVASDPDQQRGEHVIVVAGRGEEADAKLAEGQRIFAILREELPPAKAAKLAAAISGAPRKELYEK